MIEVGREREEVKKRFRITNREPASRKNLPKGKGNAAQSEFTKESTRLRREKCGGARAPIWEGPITGEERKVFGVLLGNKGNLGCKEGRGKMGVRLHSGGSRTYRD